MIRELKNQRAATIQHRTRAPRVLLTTLWLALPLSAGCGAFSPAFVDLVDPSGNSGAGTVDNAPGHLVISFVNNAEVDERLLSYLQSAEGGGLVLTPEEKATLRPRLRFRVQVTYVDGQQAVVEMVDGSAALVSPTFNAQSEPDLNENDLDNFVVICDVARIEVVEPIEVFIPVELTSFQFVEPTGEQPGFFREFANIPPQFQSLQVDLVDADLNTILLRNIGLRDRPGPVDSPRCGAVVSVVVDGVLSVPFREDLGGVPGYETTDVAAIGTVGGRYEFRVSVQ